MCKYEYLLLVYEIYFLTNLRYSCVYPPSSHQICGSVAHRTFKSAQTSLGCTIGTLLLKGSQVEKLISSTARNITPPPLQSSSQESPSFTPHRDDTPSPGFANHFFSLIGGIISHRANSITPFNTRGTRSYCSGGIIAPLDIVIADKKGGFTRDAEWTASDSMKVYY